MEASRLSAVLFVMSHRWMNGKWVLHDVMGTTGAWSEKDRLDPAETLILLTKVTEALRRRARVVADTDLPEGAGDKW
jgi:hypothetical protein